jgi:hypothetical protein
MYSIPLLRQYHSVEERNGQEIKMAAILKCESPYVRHTEMEGFQAAKKDMESRSKHPAWRWKEAACCSNNSLQRLTVNFYEDLKYGDWCVDSDRQLVFTLHLRHVQKRSEIEDSVIYLQATLII